MNNTGIFYLIWLKFWFQKIWERNCLQKFCFSLDPEPDPDWAKMLDPHPDPDWAKMLDPDPDWVDPEWHKANLDFHLISHEYIALTRLLPVTSCIVDSAAIYFMVVRSRYLIGGLRYQPIQKEHSQYIAERTRKVV
jgi:hypothetical protein